MVGDEDPELRREVKARDVDFRVLCIEVVVETMQVNVIAMANSIEGQE